MNGEAVVARLGNRSATIDYRTDGVACARIEHTIVCADMARLSTCAMPEDVRAPLVTSSR